MRQMKTRPDPNLRQLSVIVGAYSILTVRRTSVLIVRRTCAVPLHWTNAPRPAATQKVGCWVPPPASYGVGAKHPEIGRPFDQPRESSGCFALTLCRGKHS